MFTSCNAQTICNETEPRTCPLLGVLRAQAVYREAEHLAGRVDLTDELQDGAYVPTHIVLRVTNLGAEHKDNRYQFFLRKLAVLEYDNNCHKSHSLSTL